MTAAKLPSVWRLTKEGVVSLGRHWALILGVVAVVTIPVNLINLSSELAADRTIAAYTGLAALLMNLATIWVIFRLEHGQRPTVKEAYQVGTATLVRFLLVTLVLVLMLLPLIVAVYLATAGMVGAAGVAERGLLAGLALILSLPTVWWWTRNFLALFIIPEGQAGPLQALRASRQLVKGRFWPVLGRLVALGVVLAIVGTGLAVPTVLAHSRYGVILAQMVGGLLILPFINLYLYGLYTALKK